MELIPKVSVIMAAYNAEKYISRALDSILAQTMNDFELIVVDDGSTDTTADIVDAYATRDTRVRVIHQDNGGVAKARQAGIDFASGEYTIHMDSDDWADSEMLQDMYDAAIANSADILICDYYETFPDREVYNTQRLDPADRVSVFGQMLNNLAGALWNKLIRRELYAQYGVRFNPEIRDEEDKLICLKFLSQDITVSYLGKAFYHYDHRANQQSLTKKKYAIVPRMRILDEVAAICDLSPVRRYFDNAVFYIAYQGLYVTVKEERTYQDMFLKYWKSLLRSNFPLRSKLLVFLRLIGICVPMRLIKKNK